MKRRGENVGVIRGNYVDTASALVDACALRNEAAYGIGAKLERTTRFRMVSLATLPFTSTGMFFAASPLSPQSIALPSIQKLVVLLSMAVFF